MKALFKVTISQRNSFMAFTSENVIAGNAIDAAKRVEKYVKATYIAEKGLYASNVEMLGIVTVD